MEGTHFDGDLRGRVLDATNIVELIQRTVPLKRRGKDYLGLCPFHQEKTPSFTVSPERQFFYCYGCKKGGNAIDFVIERDRIEFKDAMRQLAEAAGIPFTDANKGGPQRGEMQILRDAMSAATTFFEKLLAHPAGGKVARDYLASRGFNAESIQRFHIGLAADSWDAFLSSAAARKFTPGQLVLAGLLKPREQGEGHYDTFRNRLMFPIRDPEGRVIAFGGRIMPGGDDQAKLAKYLNSPQTPLFDKGKCAFGLDLARQKIVDTRTVAVVEGYTDVVMAHQFGCSNVVSTLGTALTPRHLATLSRYADRVVLVFDPDAAGEAAVDRAVELFLTQDKVEIFIATLPEGLDPDEFLLKYGAEAFNATLSQAVDALTYAWKQLNSRFIQRANDLTGQQKAVDEYLTLLAGARQSGHVDPIRWGAALHRVSRLTGMPPEQLHRRLKSRPPQTRQTAQVPSVTKPKSEILTAQDRAEAFILGYLLCEPGKWAQVQAELQPNDFGDVRHKALAEIYWQHQQDEGEPVLNQFLSLLEGVNVGEQSIKELAVKLAQEAQRYSDPVNSLKSCLEYFHDQRLRLAQENRQAQLRRSGDGTGNGPDAAIDEAAVLQQISDFSRTPDPRRLPVRYGA